MSAVELSNTVYTIGHSTHSLEDFTDLLLRHAIETVVDVRSVPFSRQAPQFNQDILRAAMQSQNLRYLFGGKQLGGRPPETELYDSDGRVLYWKLAQAARFRSGVDGLRKLLATRQRVVIMCSEENPHDCHRRLLIGRVLREQGMSLVHIRGNGSLEQEDGPVSRQVSLLGGLEDDNWKSILSVLPKSQRKPSLHN